MSMNYDIYLKVCKEAVENRKVFDHFRGHPQYAGVVETMASYKWGVPYISILQSNYPHLWKEMSKFATSDAICGARQFVYGHLRISPITLRYVKVLADLETRFGSLDGWNIIEIGGGYGGQCKIIQDHFKVGSYTLIDLPDPLALADKWLKAQGIDTVILRAHNDNTHKQYDLVISNYAFTEFDGDTQNFYHKNIINYARHGFIICNFMRCRKSNGEYTEDDVLKIHDNYVILPEEPLTATDNFIYTW